MDNPLTIFASWFEEAGKNAAIADHSAMAVATADRNGRPSVRILLLKHFDDRGFVFYTNMESRKSQELKENPYAALCFHWQPLARQVRIEGVVHMVDEGEADRYFSSRPLISRIGALVSRQSAPLDSREALMRKVKEAEARYSAQNPPERPAFWSGWRVVPEKMEFWQEGEFRLHNRALYSLDAGVWKTSRLYP